MKRKMFFFLNLIEAKNAENKRLLDEKALAIEQLNREVMETVDAVCKGTCPRKTIKRWNK